MYILRRLTKFLLTCLITADPGLIPGTPDGSKSLPGVIFECSNRSRIRTVGYDFKKFF